MISSKFGRKYLSKYLGKSRNSSLKQDISRNKQFNFVLYSLGKGLAFAPRFMQVLFICFIFCLLFILPNSFRGRTRRSLTLFLPQQNFLQREILIHKNIFQSLNVLTDMLSMWFRGKEWAAKRIKKVHDEHIIMDSLKNNRNVIYVSYHFGNWELLAAYLAEKHQFYNIYKEVSNPYINDTIQQYRKSCNITGVSVDNKMQLRQLITALRKKENHALLLMPDQRPQNNAAYTMANFFGISTPFSSMPFKLFPLVNSDVILIGALNCGGGNYEVFVKKAPQEIYGKDTLAAINAMNREYEKIINLDRSQYNWFQDKFKYARGEDKKSKS